MFRGDSCDVGMILFATLFVVAFVVEIEYEPAWGRGGGEDRRDGYAVQRQALTRVRQGRGSPPARRVRRQLAHDCVRLRLRGLVRHRPRSGAVPDPVRNSANQGGGVWYGVRALRRCAVPPSAADTNLSKYERGAPAVQLRRSRCPSTGAATLRWPSCSH